MNAANVNGVGLSVEQRLRARTARIVWLTAQIGHLVQELNDMGTFHDPDIDPEVTREQNATICAWQAAHCILVADMKPLARHNAAVAVRNVALAILDAATTRLEVKPG